MRHRARVVSESRDDPQQHQRHVDAFASAMRCIRIAATFSKAFGKGFPKAFRQEARMTEQIGTSPKKPAGSRGMAQASLDLIDAMYEITAAAKPISGRGVGYKLFTRGLIPSMSTRDMKRVYRLLTQARERSIIPWSWIVDETRELERVASWSEPSAFIDAVHRSYRRDFWTQQPVRCEVWSEKGTVRGLLKPVLDEFGVGFRVMHGFGGAGVVHDIAADDDGRELIILYAGDYDPSGLCMSERDLPQRIARYGGAHVRLKRIALTKQDVVGLPSFPAADKKRDSRYLWFVENFGQQCWELDAMDPNDLRNRVREAITGLIEWDTWVRCETVENAERESLQHVLDQWRGAA